MKRRCNIMISAAGRRVALVRLFEQALKECGCEGRVYATDITATSPAYQACQHHALVPSYRDPACLEALLEFCRKHHIDLIIPTIDPDLVFFAKHRDDFLRQGVQIHLSSDEVISLAADKASTAEWLNLHDFPAPKLLNIAAILDRKTHVEFPLFAKPRRGAAGIGAGPVNSMAELELRSREHNLIVQEIAEGDEYTVDAFIDRGGDCLCTVPRKRLEIRAGEVSKGITARVPTVCDLAKRVAQALPGARGVINIQMIFDRDTGSLQVIEINPRFGGGYPLTHESGAPMANWVIEEAVGLPCTAQDDAWRQDRVMLRYDEAVFVSREEAGLEASG